MGTTTETTREVYVLSIDGDDYYAATLHNTVESVFAELRREVRTNGFLPTVTIRVDDELDDLIERLQDHGVETNVTLTAVPAVSK